MAEKITQLTNNNSTDKASLFAALSFMTNQMKLNTDGMIPAKVVSYDRDANVATVKPVIHFLALDGKEIHRDELTQINVLSIGGGGFHISFPLKAGDLGWIFASDRDLTKFKKDLAEGAPSNGQAKTFASGLFIPDVFRQYTINGEDSGAMVIQATDGATRVAIDGNEIRMTAKTLVKIDAPTTQVMKELIVEGLATMNGGVTAKDGTAVTLPSTTTVAGKNVNDHGHEQNGDSGRTSGGMLP
ncbi:baseplate assembly protein [Pantoea phage Kyle]|uniref:Baseplate assembly protein n=1 Tax=Pantoea phage Kyle TaxID=2589665 RepID=A0A514A8N2_9CAUD|nr:baseplate assembly protein [Pantoea phage Kyle]QDH49609.1 baseplate assembly protein [Pantoea phage Kyle]